MKKRTFNYFSRDKALPSPSGCRKEDVHRLVRDGNNLTLEKTGEIDIHEMIQSYEDGVSLEKMIQRFQRGDDLALQRKSAFYSDVSGYSNDLHDVMRNNRFVGDALTQLRDVDQVDDNPTITDSDETESEVTDNNES